MAPLELESLARRLEQRPEPGQLDACIVLNHDLPRDAGQCVDGARVVIACDGGANRLKEVLPQAPVDAIVGDMDSVREDSISHFERVAQERGRECKVLRFPEDQETTDLEKGLSFFYEHQRQASNSDKSDSSDGNPLARRPVIAVIGVLSGRLDHTLQNLNIALRHVERARLLFVADGCYAEVLPAGETTLRLAKGAGEGPACGIVPLGGPVRGTTTGLVWNLKPTAELELKWGGLLSTSNLVQEGTNTVTFDMSDHVLWTIERQEPQATN